MRVLRGSGVASEAELPFAALHQLLQPVLGYLGRLPEPQAAALGGALGMSVFQPENRFVISLAVLTLLSEAAEEGPILCLIDDAHWADQPSADALAFVARRLDAEEVVILIAVREGEGRAFPSAGLPVAGVARLERSEAAELLRDRFGSGLSSGVCDRLVESAGGNPLALLEMPTALTDRQRDGRDPLPQPVPLGQGLEQALLGSSRRLSEPAQMLLLVAAAEGSGEAGVIVAAANLLGAGEPTGRQRPSSPAGSRRSLTPPGSKSSHCSPAGPGR